MAYINRTDWIVLLKCDGCVCVWESVRVWVRMRICMCVCVGDLHTSAACTAVGLKELCIQKQWNIVGLAWTPPFLFHNTLIVDSFLIESASLVQCFFLCEPWSDENYNETEFAELVGVFPTITADDRTWMLNVHWHSADFADGKKALLKLLGHVDIT